METNHKHMREPMGQVEEVSKAQVPVADSRSQAGEDNSGKFFLRLVGVVVLIIALISIGATSCGKATQGTGTGSENHAGSSRGSDALEDDDSDSSSLYGSDDYSYDHSDRDYSSDNEGYQRVYDEDSGIYGVVGEDGDGLFAGEDFSMRVNEDGSSIATDGNGNWVMDSDGDGEVDSISIDDGDTWF